MSVELFDLCVFQMTLNVQTVVKMSIDQVNFVAFLICFYCTFKCHPKVTLLVNLVPLR